MASKYGRHHGGGPPIVNRYPGVTSVRGSAASGEHPAALTTLIRTGDNEFTGQFEVAEVWFSGLDEAIDSATVDPTGPPEETGHLAQGRNVTAAGHVDVYRAPPADRARAERAREACG
ncbi:hypothetical protein AB0E82_18785 [Streptomyces anulatus]|uniref:hypothetical protein n=1 Tax=Streptomyces anulatus TaxID=1892 RepID=UPI0033F8046E